MDFLKRIEELSAIYDDDAPRAVDQESRPMFDKGGMAKLVSYVEGLPKGSTVTAQILQDYADKNNLDVNLKNFFNRNAKTIKDKTFISDTRSKDLKLTSEEKANIEKYGQKKYDKLTDKSDKLRVRKGQDVGSLSLEKQQKVKFKKEYDKAIKYYKSRGIEEPNMDSIRKNIARNDGKFNATGSKLQAESGLTGLFKNYEKADLIADLKKGKNLSEISIEYLDKNEKQVLKMLEGKRDYSKPLGRLSTDLSNIISGDEEATKLYNKIKKQNSFNKLKNKSTYKKAVETLIPFAQEQGLIPNVNLKGKKINTASDYFNYAYKVKRDPIAKLFGFYERVGIEHPAGVARALIFDDPATLNEIVATMPDTNLAAGSTYDTYATGQARFFEKTKDPKYIKKINQIILNKQKEYGKPRTILDVDGDNVTRRTTKFSLTNPNLIEDSKSFINEYVAAGGSQRKNFNKLDPSLQQSILAFEEGDKIKGNKFLKIALKDTGAEADAKEIIQNIQSYSKLSQCRIDKADGGRIGFAYSDECIRDGLKEQKIEAQKGNKKAAQELVQVGKVATRAGLLKNILGPGAILSEIVLEGAIIGNKVLGGKPGDIAWAESYLSYLDPRKYRGELDPLKMRREDMTTREIEDADGNIKTIDGPNANILRSGFAAQDQLSAFNEAVNEKFRGERAGRLDIANKAAADVREQSKFVDRSKDIISSDAFQDASNMAQEYIQAQEGQRMFPYNQFKKSISKFESGEDRDYRRRKEQEMKNLYTQYSDKNIMDMLSSSKVLQEAGISPQEYLNMMAGTERITPAVTSTMSGLDRLKTGLQEKESLARFADNFRTEKAGGGIAGLSGGDRSGAMTRSMNPDSQGLSYLFNRVKKI